MKKMEFVSDSVFVLALFVIFVLVFGGASYYRSTQSESLLDRMKAERAAMPPIQFDRSGTTRLESDWMAPSPMSGERHDDYLERMILSLEKHVNENMEGS